uniref:Uncharacterized protein n=1 Tax=Oryza sativa subsp. japonica TaxID=39947 RepID=Q6Z2X1_ORYSJ|nr:hypothetical protein [Oryza sativa Japonica Group]
MPPDDDDHKWHESDLTRIPFYVNRRYLSPSSFLRFSAIDTAAATCPFLIVPAGGRGTLAAVVKGISGQEASPAWTTVSPGGRPLRGIGDRGAEGEARQDERHGGRRSVTAAARVGDGDMAVDGVAIGTWAVAGALAGGVDDDNAGAARPADSETRRSTTTTKCSPASR